MKSIFPDWIAWLYGPIGSGAAGEYTIDLAMFFFLRFKNSSKIGISANHLNGTMKILVIGETHHFEECKLKFGDAHTYQLFDDHGDAERELKSYDVIFDFVIEEAPEEFSLY